MMEDFGGFDHNAQSLAVVTRLERCYPRFEGLNLTWEPLEGLVKHNGPLVMEGERGFLPHHIKDFVCTYDLELHTFASAEAQVASLADDIAYNNHDIDDGLRAKLFEIKDMSELPLVGRIFSSVEEEYPNIDTSLIIHEAVRRLIGDMVSDCLAETENRLKQSAPKTVTDIRNLNCPVVGFSGDMVDIDRSLKEFLFENMYRHEKVNTMTREASKIVCRLFEEFISDPTKLPKEWQAKSDIKGGEITARAVADYIAGMTDRFAYVEHAKLIKT